MPLNVSNIAMNEASVALTIAGETVNIVYYPNKLTSRVIAQMGQSLEALSGLLSEVVKSWDVMQDENTVYPLDANSLSDLSLALVKEIAFGIVSDIRPN